MSKVKICPLLIGQDPSKNGDPKRPLSDAVGRKLSSLMGIDFWQYLFHFDRTNLYPAHQGDRFPKIAARWRADRMLDSGTFGGRPFSILLGRRVGEAFGYNGPYFQEFRLAGRRCYLAPHPSGLNRWWNDPTNRRSARRFFLKIGRMV